MKHRNFLERLKFAAAGIRHTFIGEINFRIQLVLGTGAILLLVLFQAAPVWWAAFFVVIGGVLCAEVFNTAIESLADALHPELHPLVGRAKDCAAAGVLLWSAISLCVLGFFIYAHVLR